MKSLSKKEIIYLTMGIVLGVAGLGTAALLIMTNADAYMFLAISLGNALVSVATFFFVNFGLNRYIVSKSLSPTETKKANVLAILLSVGIAACILFLIPFGKVMIDRASGIVIWAAVIAGIIAALASSICTIAGINWNKTVVNRVTPTNDLQEVQAAE